MADGLSGHYYYAYYLQQLKIKNMLKKIALLMLGLIFVWIEIVFINTIWPDTIFDRFIYRKSPWHGYGNVKGDLCRAQLNSDGYRDKEFYSKKSGEYLILVVGDSVVYGQGLLKHQRFTNILEKKLDNVRSTRILNLGNCGGNIYQHFLAAEKFDHRFKPDLIIIGVTENDLIVWDNLQNYPPELPVTDKMVFAEKPWESDQYANRVLGSLDERSDNMEMLKFLITQLPRDNQIIYFSFNYIPSETKSLDKILRQYGLNLIDSRELYLNKYRQLSMKKSGRSFMGISQKEGHPNSLANQMFSERLYQEITSNLNYGFIQN